MHRLWTAFAVALAWPALAAPTVVEPTAERAPELSLEAAMDRVIAHHPALRGYALRSAALAAEAEAAAQAPALRVELALENVLGSAALRGVDGAELSLSLAGVLERGGKREARRALAATRVDALGAQRAAAELDLLAEVARRYLDLAEWQERAPLLEDALAARREIASAARDRHARGAEPQTAALAAEAALAQAELQREARVDAEIAAWHRLALLWGETQPAAIPQVTRLPSAVAGLPEPAELRALLEQTPELRAFADLQRLGEASLRLAQSSAHTDLEWQLGLRRLQDSQDNALIAGLSMPLGSRRRAQPGIAAADAHLAALDSAQAAEAQRLEATALAALATAQQHSRRAAGLQQRVLPAQQRAAASARSAYRAGALTWLEWASLQNEVLATQLEILDARAGAQRALIELQRLTAEPFGQSDRRESTRREGAVE